MKFLIFACATLLSQAAYAEDCSSVIALSKISSTTVSSRNSFEQAASRFCNEYSKAKNSGSSMNAGGSYGVISASFGQSSSSSEQAASKICSADDNSKKADNAFEEYVNTIAPGAFSAYEQCITLSNSNIKFSVDEAAILPKQLVMTVNYTNHNGKSQAAHLMYFASDGVSCNWSAGVGANAVLQSPENVSLACSRPTSANKAFVTVTRTDGGGKISLPWPAYSAEGIPVNTVASLDQQIAELKNELSYLKTSIGGAEDRASALIADFEANKKSNMYTIVSNTSSCPAGWARLGMIGFIVSNGDYATASMGQGGAFNDAWTWTHPLLCRRN